MKDIRLELMDDKEYNEGLKLMREFNEQVFIHKGNIILSALEVFYKDLATMGTVNIPEFMDVPPQEKARNHFIQLLSDRKMFNDIYNKCWERYKEVLN